MSELIESNYEVDRSEGDPYDKDPPEVWRLICHDEHSKPQDAVVYDLAHAVMFGHLTMEDLNRSMREHHERFHA